MAISPQSFDRKGIKEQLLIKIYKSSLDPIKAAGKGLSNAIAFKYEGFCLSMYLNRPVEIVTSIGIVPLATKHHEVFEPWFQKWLVLYKEHRIIEQFITAWFNKARTFDQAVSIFPKSLGGSGFDCDAPEMKLIKKRILLGSFE